MWRALARQLSAARCYSSIPTRLSSFETLVPSEGQRSTIFALSTPPGKAGIAVIRVSGSEAFNVWHKIIRSYKHSLDTHRLSPIPWRMQRCRIIDPERNETIDSGLAVFFKGPNSFTTEDVLELHIHSGRAIISSVLKTLSKLPFCRLADAGEFTKRAFLAGRLDLTEVEGIKDLVEAETELQLRHALRAAQGIVRSEYEKLRSEIIRCLALVEALIDFGEGEDIEEGVYEAAKHQVELLAQEIRSVLQDQHRGEILRSGIKVAIFGPPNAGKSSLLNYFAGREAAIVTPIPGTTRDIMELSLDIDGLPIIIVDTAGIRKTDDLVEAIGIQRAQTAIQVSDVSICVLSLPEIVKSTTEGLRIHVPTSMQGLITSNTFILANKLDLCGKLPSLTELSQALGTKVNLISLNTGEGISPFLNHFSQKLQKRYDLNPAASQRVSLVSRARHRAQLETALTFLESFLMTGPGDVVCGAEELRYAAQAIGKISGSVAVDDILDVIFKEFCIGK